MKCRHTKKSNNILWDIRHYFKVTGYSEMPCTELLCLIQFYAFTNSLIISLEYLSIIRNKICSEKFAHYSLTLNKCATNCLSHHLPCLLRKIKGNAKLSSTEKPKTLNTSLLIFNISFHLKHMCLHSSL